MKWIGVFLSLLLTCLSSSAFELPSNCQQAIVGIAPDWNSSHVTLRVYEKRQGKWQPVSSEWKGRLGKSGLAWGIGLSPVPRDGRRKKEGDWRAPAGVFDLGEVWGYAAKERVHPRQKYHQITTRDLWVEDSKSPSYNRHLQLKREPRTKWEKDQQMRQNDHPHSLKLFIAHNAGRQTTPGAGSAIFFHIWRREGKSPTAGCTTMPEPKLKELVRLIDPSKRPVYILLPQSTYRAQRAAWKLP